MTSLATVSARREAKEMTEGTGRGTPALLVVGQVLKTAAVAVATEEGARAHLKVRSGEHLAAIFLSRAVWPHAIRLRPRRRTGPRVRCIPQQVMVSLRAPCRL
jgi:hypothetical protein